MNMTYLIIMSKPLNPNMTSIKRVDKIRSTYNVE